MEKKDLEYFKSFILEKRQEILQNKRKFLLDSSHTHRKIKNLNDSNYMVENSSDTMTKEFDSYFNARTEKYLKHLDDALERIANGNYGICIMCGSQIPKERLNIVPHTRYCVSCKNHDE
jgi:DnaK suppressor protein